MTREMGCSNKDKERYVVLLLILLCNQSMFARSTAYHDVPDRWTDIWLKTPVKNPLAQEPLPRWTA